MNYSIGAGSAQANVITQLPGNAIHTVKWMGAEAKDIEPKNGGDKMKLLVLKFKNADGVFEETIFEGKPGDDKRVVNQWKYESPSAVEETMFKIKHLIAALNPKVAEHIEKKGFAVTSWDELRAFVVKHTTQQIGTETQIKIFSRTDSKGVVRTNFPSFVLSISKAGELYPKTNFIGAKLAFTAKEQEKINNATSGKPSDMSSKMGNALPETPEIPALTVDDLSELDLSNI